MTSVCWARSRYTNSSKFSWIRSRCVVCEEIKLHITILWRTAYEKKNSESRFCKLFMSNLRRIWCGSFSWQHRSRGNHTIFLSNASAMRRARKRHHATRWNSYIFIVARSHQYDKRIHGEKKSMHCKMRRKKMPQQYRKPYQSVANKSHFIHLFHVVFGSVFFFFHVWPFVVRPALRHGASSLISPLYLTIIPFSGLHRCCSYCEVLLFVFMHPTDLPITTIDYWWVDDASWMTTKRQFSYFWFIESIAVILPLSREKKNSFVRLFVF